MKATDAKALRRLLRGLCIIRRNQVLHVGGHVIREADMDDQKQTAPFGPPVGGTPLGPASVAPKSKPTVTIRNPITGATTRGVVTPEEGDGESS